MIETILGAYFGALLACYVSTVILIVSKNDWGDLPYLFVKAIEFIQAQLTPPSADSENNNSNEFVFGKHHLTPTSVKAMSQEPFELSAELVRSGIECILQDDIERPFHSAPTGTWTMMSLPPRPDIHLQIIYGMSVAIRWGFLFPLRLMFLFTSLAWALSTGLLVILFPFINQETTRYFGITFAKLSRVSIGTIVRSHDTQNRPKSSGIAVANHMTANDIFSLFSDCQYDGVGYTVTGQKHRGLPGLLEKLGEKLTQALWLDREDLKDRANFQQKVINYASTPDVYPVLLFPEGFCSNLTTVLQFRKAVFTGEVPIYPIAVSQNARVGDSFWKEDTFVPFVIRIMTSFANVYEICYLPTMTKKENEDSAAFAGRVQSAIAARLGIPALPYDGGLKKEKNRESFKKKIQNSIFEHISV